MIEISADGIGAVMRLHGHSLNETENPLVHNILKGLLSEGLVKEDSIVNQLPGMPEPVSIFKIFRQMVLERYTGQLNDQQLFQIVEILEFLDHMVDKDGMNLPPHYVFRFLQRELGIIKN